MQGNNSTYSSGLFCEPPLVVCWESDEGVKFCVEVSETDCYV